MKNIIGIDIGASKILFVLMKDKKIIKSKKIKTPKNRKQLIKVLKENIGQVRQSVKISALGLAVAGLLDEKREKILNSPNLKFLNNFALVKVLEKKTGLKVVMENDANCFVLAEAKIGAGRNKKSVFGITLGSGVGGGLVINGKIYQGASGGAGEIGHTIIKFDGPKCSCKSFGCFEEYGGERFFKRKKVFSTDLFEKAKQGDKKARIIFKEYGKYLGITIANLVNLLEPEVIVLGGGITNARRYFLKEAKKEAQKRIISPLAKRNFKIQPAKLGELSGAAGAGLLVN